MMPKQTAPKRAHRRTLTRSVLAALESLERRLLLADITTAFIGEGERFGQINSASPIALAVPFEVVADMRRPAGTQNILSASLVEIDNNATHNLELDGESFDLSGQTFSTFADLAASFPSTSYHLSVTTVNDGTHTFTLPLGGAAFPGTPHVNNFDALQTANPRAPIVISWDPFVGGGAGDVIDVEIRDSSGNALFDSGVPGLATLNGTATSEIIPAGTLQAGQTYRVFLRFGKITGVDNASYPGVPGSSVVFTETRFPLITSGTSDNNGNLQTNGSTGNDTASVAMVNGQIAVTLDGVTQTFDPATVSTIGLNLGAGTDFVAIGPGVPAVNVGGGAGNDTLVGGSDSDTLSGGKGADSIGGGAGNDSLAGGKGADTIEGGQGNDLLGGGQGNDLLIGGTGNNIDVGGLGADILASGQGDDSLSGGAGTDIFLNAGGLPDTVDGGAGINSAQLDTTDVVTNIEIILDPAGPVAAQPAPAPSDLLAAAQTIRGADAPLPTAALVNGTLTITGTAGNDFVAVTGDGAGHLLVNVVGGSNQSFDAAQVTGVAITGGDGNDTLLGDNSVQVPMAIHGGAGDDSIVGGGTADSLSGGDGDDRIRGLFGADTLDGGNGDDILNGNKGNDSVIGSEDNDFLIGGPGNDTLDGGDGNDHLIAGTVRTTTDDGSDLLIGGAGIDTADYISRFDPLFLSNDGQAHSGNAAAGEHDAIMPDIERIEGGGGGDTIVGTATPESFLSAGVGNDSITGGSAGAVIVPNPGDDTVVATGAESAIFTRDNPPQADNFALASQAIHCIVQVDVDDVQFTLP